MTISLSLFSGLIVVALGLVTLAPLFLLILLIRDWLSKELW